MIVPLDIVTWLPITVRSPMFTSESITAYAPILTFLPRIALGSNNAVK